MGPCHQRLHLSVQHHYLRSYRPCHRPGSIPSRPFRLRRNRHDRTLLTTLDSEDVDAPRMIATRQTVRHNREVVHLLPRLLATSLIPPKKKFSAWSSSHSAPAIRKRKLAKTSTPRSIVISHARCTIWWATPQLWPIR